MPEIMLVELKTEYFSYDDTTLKSIMNLIPKDWMTVTDDELKILIDTLFFNSKEYLLLEKVNEVDARTLISEMIEDYNKKLEAKIKLKEKDEKDEQTAKKNKEKKEKKLLKELQEKYGNN